MKAVQVSRQPGRAGQTLFATSFGVSLLVHGLVIGWMLSGSGAARSLLAAAPSFHAVSLVDAPVAFEPQAIAEPAAMPEVVTAAPVRNVVPETAVAPPQAKQATDVPEASVEPAAPAAKPEPIEAPQSRPVVETRISKPEPAKASARKAAPTETAARKPTPAAPRVAAAQPPAAAPRAALKPRAPASRNSPQAAARAQQTIANLRRAQARLQGTSTIQARGGIAAQMQNIQMQAYYGRVRARITDAWQLPMMQQTAQTLQAVALLTVDREGRMIRYELLTSSGSPAFDASLRRAVRASLPLPELPETFPEETLEFEFHFEPPASS